MQQLGDLAAACDPRILEWYDLDLEVDFEHKQEGF